MATKQPTSLLDLASCAVGKFIGEQALLVMKEINLRTESSKGNIDLELNIKKCAQFYDVTIPCTLHNVVTYHTLVYITSKNFEITRNNVDVFDLVLRCHVTKFSFLEWPLKMHHMLHVNLPKLKDLKFLYLVLSNKKNENLEYILKGIEGMIQLETFKCNDYNSDVIRVLCDNCPLKNLELYCSNCSDTDILISSLLKLKYLDTLEIRGVDISKEEQKHLLFGLPCLRNYKNYDLHLLFPDITDGNVTPLQKVSYHCSKEHEVTNLTKFCPYITDLCIITFLNQPFDLSNLATLKYLTSLNVTCDFYKSNIMTILEARGYQLTKFGIHCENITLRTLYMIDSLCPNLVKLALDCVSFNDEEAEFQANKGIVFQKLESFSNTVSTHENDLTPCLIFFLRNCKTLKEVEFLSASNLKDTDIFEILKVNPLLNLQKFFLGRHNLTAGAILKLLFLCKQIRWLGYVIEWRNFTRDEVKALFQIVQQCNFDVNLISHYSYTGSYIPSVMLRNRQLWSYATGKYAFRP